MVKKSTNKEVLKLLNLTKRLKSLADTGLVYNKENYDAERYEEIRELSLQMMQELTDIPVSILKDFYLPEEDYPTPKVDVRAMLFNPEQQILLVKEHIDDCWTLPGGWADIGLTPQENVIKEMKEEAGFDIEVKRLLAVLDKRKYDHPPQPHYVYKLIFLCKKVGGAIDPNFDIKEVGWFNIDDLPELSQDRILKVQLEELYTIATQDLPVRVD